MKLSSGRIFSTGIITIFLSTGLSLPSQADPFGNPRADNKVHFVCWVPYASTGRTAPAELNNYLTYVNQSVFPKTGVYAYPYPCESLVDVFYDDDLRDDRYLGIRFCNQYTDGTNVCIEGEVKININAIATAAAQNNVSETALRQSTWCHETGHTFGLQHAEDGSCLTETTTPYQTYSAHQYQHLLNDLPN